MDAIVIRLSTTARMKTAANGAMAKKPGRHETTLLRIIPSVVALSRQIREL